MQNMGRQWRPMFVSRSFRRRFVLQRPTDNVVIKVNHLRGQRLIFRMPIDQRPQGVRIAQHPLKKLDIHVVQRLALINFGLQIQRPGKTLRFQTLNNHGGNT